MNMEPSRVDDGLFPRAIAKTLDDATKAGVRRARLKQWIISTVRDPDMHESTAGRAADLVVYCGVPLADLTHILTDLKAMRPKLKGPAGAFFTFKLKTLAAIHGIDWQNPRRGNS